MWYCTECGDSTLEPARPEDGVFTVIDTRARYNLGYCDCTPDRRVAVVKDPALAADIACGVGTFHVERGEQTSWLG